MNSYPYEAPIVSVPGIRLHKNNDKQYLFPFLMNLWPSYLHALVRCQGSVQNRSQCGVVKKKITLFTI